MKLTYWCRCGLSMEVHKDPAVCPTAECPIHGRRLVTDLLRETCVNCKRAARLTLDELVGGMK